MRKLIVGTILLLSLPALGGESSKSSEAPDPNKVVNITVGELQVILAKGEIDAKFAAVIAKINEQIKAK